LVLRLLPLPKKYEKSIFEFSEISKIFEHHSIDIKIKSKIFLFFKTWISPILTGGGGVVRGINFWITWIIHPVIGLSFRLELVDK
jgi:hypothetical protein